jgi:hypothetical protein
MRGMQTPIRLWNNMSPSTRDMIDLTFEDENDTKVEKKEPSNSLAHNPDPPQTVTLRKRPKNDTQDEIPLQLSPLKKRKSPTGEALPITQRDSRSVTSSVLRPPPKESGFTQVPDSEGEDIDEFGYDDLHSDHIPVEAKELLQETPADIAMLETNDQEENIVPESPPRVGQRYHTELENQVQFKSSNSLNHISVSQTAIAMIPKVLLQLITLISR